MIQLRRQGREIGDARHPGPALAELLAWPLVTSFLQRTV